MRNLLGDSLAELLALALTALGSGILALGGLVIELAAVGNLSTGHATIGIWELCVGGLLLYAGVYMLGYRRVVATVRQAAE
jgi:hypothetical protein